MEFLKIKIKFLIKLTSLLLKRPVKGNTEWPDSVVQFLTLLMKLQSCKVAVTIFDVLTCSSNTDSVFLRRELPCERLDAIQQNQLRFSTTNHSQMDLWYCNTIIYAKFYLNKGVYCPLYFLATFLFFLQIKCKLKQIRTTVL